MTISLSLTPWLANFCAQAVAASALLAISAAAMAAPFVHIFRITTPPQLETFLVSSRRIARRRRSASLAQLCRATGGFTFRFARKVSRQCAHLGLARPLTG